jgi:hypothetical protein
MRDLGNLDSALCRGDDQRLGARPVNLDPKVGFLLDVDRLVDQHLFHRIAGDLHAQHLSGQAPRLVSVIREPDSSSLPASAGQHLCFEHDALPDTIRNSVDFVDRACHVPRWHRDTVSLQYLLGLIFV